MVNHYPLLFTPIHKKMIWGSESWDISCRPNEMGIIKNGPNLGMTFENYIDKDRIGTLGTRIAAKEGFPLLVKIIDARDTLSVQVHPGDDYVAGASDTGKTEMWYILSPPTDGQLVIGLKPGITPFALRRAFETDAVEECLNRLTVKTGDIVNIPAGLVHALTPGAIVAEVQQNSDITYRLYDYNRRSPDGNPRQLHVEDAIAVTDFDSKIPKTTTPGLTIKKGDCNMVYTIANLYFGIIKYELSGKLEEASDPTAFSIFTCVKGEAEIMGITIQAGCSVFIPAGLGTFNLRSKPGETCILIKSFVPDIERDFIQHLTAYGYTNEEIIANLALGR
ncbi:MAG: class I mannose-6-phosphate isomerase [Defluviitaleaceae bacterium]|nr:class I mannose-6-phosphate isomerase [Defluviitaleaceae bacterium]